MNTSLETITPLRGSMWSWKLPMEDLQNWAPSREEFRHEQRSVEIDDIYELENVY